MPRYEGPDTRDELPAPSTSSSPSPTKTTAPPPDSGSGRGRLVARTIGEILVTLGVLVLLFVGYELYVTNWMSARLQNEANADLEERWSQSQSEPPDRQLHAAPVEGEAFARIYIPSFGADWVFTVQEGVSSAALEIGPGHYQETALPGEPGNFGIAGHRVGKGAPFNDLDLLNSCDALVIETVDTFFVYRVLPMPDEIANWSAGKGQDPKCTDVTPLHELDDAYEQTVGRVIVTPDRADAVAPVPYAPSAVLPETMQVPLLSLTTCHPQFSDRERMIIHGVLTEQYQKQPGAGYEELLREIGEV